MVVVGDPDVAPVDVIESNVERRNSGREDMLLWPGIDYLSPRVTEAVSQGGGRNRGADYGV